MAGLRELNRYDAAFNGIFKWQLLLSGGTAAVWYYFAKSQLLFNTRRSLMRSVPVVFLGTLYFSGPPCKFFLGAVYNYTEGRRLKRQDLEKYYRQIGQN